MKLDVLPAALACLVVSGCTPTSSPSGGAAPSQPPSAPAVSAVSVAPVPPPSSAPPASLLRLGEVIDRIDTDPRAAAGLLEGFRGTAIADAYRGYLALDAGDTARGDEATRGAREALSGYAKAMADIDGPVPTLGESLRVVRLAVEEHEDRERPLIACSVFEQHPKEAIRAFGGMWGSTRDSFGRDVKDTCVEKLLQRADPSKVKPTFDAVAGIIASMRTVAPLPDGTMYFAMFIGDTDAMRDILLAPELGPDTPPLHLDVELARAAKAEPALRGRMPLFEKAKAKALPDFAAAICARLAAHGKAADPAVCREKADTAATEAMAGWLASRGSATQ